ncbi:MAG: DUF4867 family protein [Christensenella sp.]|uniref:DUF4867 family protein n=1 Tax=Christensenella sp. TaxID=1935934 RepID=UPI002B1FF291|nr:DUF4867 family protein [Christensenella sp.]MEA5003566.1 DUF4867 family protein [Christensenella sp.]
MDIKSVSSSSFEKYGRILAGHRFPQLISAMENTPQPDSVVYEPDVPAFHDLSEAAVLKDSVFGGMPIQIGYCNGKNDTLSAVEYHRSSEINIACTDLILMLGRQQDIDAASYTYDTSRMEAFSLPAGTAVELYATTLHYAPCAQGGNAFRCVVVLSAGTNLPLQNASSTGKEDALLFARNKWLIAHKESGLEKDGAFIGLVGDNLTL